MNQRTKHQDNKNNSEHTRNHKNGQKQDGHIQEVMSNVPKVHYGQDINPDDVYDDEEDDQDDDIKMNDQKSKKNKSDKNDDQVMLYFDLFFFFIFLTMMIKSKVSNTLYVHFKLVHYLIFKIW